MSVDGKWTITVKSPMGPQKSLLDIQSTGEKTFTGTSTGQGQTTQLSEGKIDGNNISWVAHLTQPMKMKVEFTAAIDGDSIAGKCKVGIMGSFAFTGGRGEL